MHANTLSSYSTAAPNAELYLLAVDLAARPSSPRPPAPLFVSVHLSGSASSWGYCRPRRRRARAPPRASVAPAAAAVSARSGGAPPPREGGARLVRTGVFCILPVL